MRTNIDEAKSVILTYKLPRGFLLKEGDEVHILNNATIREMTGDDEDIIANDSKGFTERMHQLVGNCLTSLSDGQGKTITDKNFLANVPKQLLMSDLLVSILRIRQVTVGDEVRQKIRCPSCTNDEGKPYIWTAILSLKDFDGLPVEGDPLKNIRECTTSRGTKVIWEMMTGEIEIESGKKKNTREKATLALMARVRDINGETDSKKIKAILKSMSFVERQEIRKEFDAEGGIETDFDCICNNCGHEFKANLDIGGTSFFLPSETSED